MNITSPNRHIPECEIGGRFLGARQGLPLWTFLNTGFSLLIGGGQSQGVKPRPLTVSDRGLGFRKMSYLM